MSKIAITGSEGFVGSLLSKMLSLPDTHRFDATIGHDITQDTTTDSIVQRADTVIHLAALSGLAACDKSPSEAKLVNHTATLSIAQKMYDMPGQKRLIFASSASVYGEAQSYLMDEQHPVEPRSTYGRTKLSAEEIMKFASRDFQIIILRPSNIYGYGTMWKDNTVMSAFISKYLSHQPIEITGTGSQKRDFVHVVDICRLYKLIATTGTIRSGIYNVGGDECISMRALAELVNDIGEAILGYRVPITYKPADNESIFHDFVYSSERAKQTFQYKPIFRIADHVKERMLIHLRK